LVKGRNNKNNWKKIAQISVEYLLITAFAFAILIPGIYFFYNYSKGGTSDIVSTQFDRIGEEMLGKALKISSQGRGSWDTLDLTVPDKIINMTINDSERELTISYWTDDGISEAVFFLPIPLTADGGTPYKNGPHPGKTYFKFIKESGGVVKVVETIN